MAAIVTVTNGITQEDEQHFNQYAQAFSNVLGITDTVQDALGRLVLPSVSGDVSTPSDYQVWMDSSSGLVKINKLTGIKALGAVEHVLYQYETITVGLSFTDTGVEIPVDVPSDGVVLFIGFVQIFDLTKDGSAGAYSIYLRLQRDLPFDPTELNDWRFGGYSDANLVINPIIPIIWLDDPTSSGVNTYKVRYSLNGVSGTPDFKFSLSALQICAGAVELVT